MSQPGDTQTLDLSGGSASDTSAALDSAADSIAAEILPRSETDESQETGADPALVSPPAADPESKTAKTSDSESFSPEQKQEQQQEIPEPPSSLTKEEKEIWNKLPQEARDIIQRREENFHKGFNELKPVADLGMGFGRILQPFMDAYRAYGVNPIAHVENLATYHHALMFGRPDQKAEIILGLARDSGVDLRQLVDGTAPDQNQSAFSEMQRELAQLRALQANAMQRFQKQDNDALYQHVKSISEDTVNFPYFMEVSDRMIDILSQEPQLGLERAYKLAVAESPAIQEKEIQKRIADANKKAQEEAARVAKARGVRIQQSSNIQPQTQGKKKVESIEDAVDDAFASLQTD